MSDPDSPLTHDPSPVRDNSPPPPLALPPPPTDPKVASSKISRRLPPPCWSLEETIALIEGYREKWYALSRGNLKANHWEEVAEAVAAACPGVTPKKTAVQCRHKMEKLRQRYRTEIQRARSVPVARFVSSWVHYKRMEAMENRPESKPDDGEEDDRYRFSGGRTTPRFFNRNGGGGGGGGSGGGGGIRIRIPTGVSVAQAGPRFPGKIEPKSSGISTNPRPGRVGTGSSYGGRVVGGDEDRAGKRGSEMMMSENPMACAIKLLGDTILRTEEKKMEMTREIEAMRMEMEMKRTKMVLESQQRIVEAFAKTMSENLEKKKKARRISSMEE